MDIRPCFPYFSFRILDLASTVCQNTQDKIAWPLGRERRHRRKNTKTIPFHRCYSLLEVARVLANRVPNKVEYSQISLESGLQKPVPGRVWSFESSPDEIDCSEIGYGDIGVFRYHSRTKLSLQNSVLDRVMVQKFILKQVDYLDIESNQSKNLAWHDLA